MIPGWAGWGADKVLCIAADHIAIEAANTQCGPVTCMPPGGNVLVNDRRTSPPAFSASCGPCTDIPGSSSVISAAPAHAAFAHWLIQTNLPASAVAATIADLWAPHAATRPPDSPVRCLSPALTTVLLI
jgi:hypothetical protein